MCVSIVENAIVTRRVLSHIHSIALAIYLIAHLPGISDQDTNDSSKVEICQVQTDSTLPWNSYNQLAHSVSKINEESTVTCDSRGGAVVMSEPKSFNDSADDGDLGIILECVRLPASGHKKYFGREQNEA